MSAFLYRVKGGFLKASLITVTTAAAALVSAYGLADPDGRGDAPRGVLCSNPSVARDLIGVVDQPSIYREWLRGYLESGYCVVWNPGEARLAQIAGSVNSQTGDTTRLWAVYVLTGKGEHRVREAMLRRTLR